MSAKTTTGAGSAYPTRQAENFYQIAFHAIVAGTGAVTATVTIEVSNDGVNFCSTPAATITLSGTTSANDGFTTNAPWRYWRANATAISGTNAAVTVYANGAISNI